MRVWVDRGTPVDLDGENGSLAPFGVLDRLAERARVAYVVEMDHFVHQKYEFRLLCARYLASHGWRFFGEELYWRHGECIDEFLRSGEESVLDLIDEPDWYESGVMKEVTARHARYVKPAMQAEQRRFARALRRLVPDARYFGFDVGAADSKYLAVANDASTYAEMRPALAMRERIMQARVTRVLDQNPGEKVALLAGGTHLMKNDEGVVPSRASGAAPSVGHHIAHEAAVGPVLSIWLLQGSGQSSNPYLGSPPVDVSPAPDTLNVELAARWTTPCLLAVGEEDEERRVTQLHQQVMSCRLEEQVDAIVFAPSVDPLRPD